MSETGEFAPTDHDWAIGEARAHLSEILRDGKYEERFGWVVDDRDLDENRMLYVSIPARRADGSLHPDGAYCLRLRFLRYPKRPPVIHYVNPKTREFDPTTDARWLPALGPLPAGTSVRYHLQYDARGQLICHSLNDEWYYRGGHSPHPATAWKPGEHTFVACLLLHQRLQTEPHYGGGRA